MSARRKETFDSSDLLLDERLAAFISRSSRPFLRRVDAASDR
jgi:hypothetical protein